MNKHDLQTTFFFNFKLLTPVQANTRLNTILLFPLLRLTVFLLVFDLLKIDVHLQLQSLYSQRVFSPYSRASVFGFVLSVTQPLYIKLSTDRQQIVVDLKFFLHIRFTFKLEKWTLASHYPQVLCYFLDNRLQEFSFDLRDVFSGIHSLCKQKFPRVITNRIKSKFILVQLVESCNRQDQTLPLNPQMSSQESCGSKWPVLMEFVETSLHTQSSV